MKEIPASPVLSKEMIKLFLPSGGSAIDRNDVTKSWRGERKAPRTRLKARIEHWEIGRLKRLLSYASLDK